MICFAADANRIASISRSVRIAAMVWLYTSLFAILPSFGIGGFVMDGNKRENRTINAPVDPVTKYEFAFHHSKLISPFWYDGI